MDPLGASILRRRYTLAHLMLRSVLHILDGSTSVDAADALALLLAADSGDASVHNEVAILGHRSTAALLDRAESTIHWLPSMGWADPTGWRTLRRLTRRLQPTHLHAWGIPAAVAASVSGSPAGRIVTLADLPASVGRGVLRFINRQSEGVPVAWVGMAKWVGEGLVRSGLSPEQLTFIPPGIALQTANDQDLALRADLGLTLEDFPIILMGGEGGTAVSRHDYGLWVGAILQQIFPRVRVVVREDARGQQNHGLERLFNDLPDGEVPIVAPAESSLERLLPLADIFLVTAHANIASGGLLHAMAAGTPIVATAVESVREIIEDGRNGLLAREIKPRAISARVEELLGNKALRDRLIASARSDIAANFSPAAMIGAFHKLYERRPVPVLQS